MLDAPQTRLLLAVSGGFFVVLVLYACARRSWRRSFSHKLYLQLNSARGDLEAHGRPLMDDSARGSAAAILLAASFCRTSEDFKWNEDAMRKLGGRSGRGCFFISSLVPDIHGSRPLLLTVTTREAAGAADSMPDSRRGFASLLTALQHPFILPVLDGDYVPERRAAVVVQPFVARGSLYDLVTGSNPKEPFARKSSRLGSPLPLDSVRRYGRQVLEALRAIRQTGLIFDHLTPTNVIIDGGSARLAAVENIVLGLPLSRARSALLTPLLSSSMDVDALLFGHLLYFMACGTEMDTPRPDYTGVDCADEVAAVLSLIFDGSGVSVDALAAHSLFQVDVGADVRSSFHFDRVAQALLSDVVEEQRSRYAALHKRLAELRGKEEERAAEEEAALEDYYEPPVARRRPARSRRRSSSARRGRRSSRLSRTRRSSRSSSSVSTAPAAGAAGAADAALPPTAEEEAVGAAAADMGAADDPDYAPFLKMLRVGVPRPIVEQKVTAAGLDVARLPADGGAPPMPAGHGHGGHGGHDDAAAAAPVAPPLPPPPVEARAPPPKTAARGALLSSITTFRRSSLVKADTVDKSGPRI